MSGNPNAWILEDFADNLDTSESEGSIQTREHLVLSRYRKIPATQAFTTQVGKTTTYLEYYVGNVRLVKTLTVSSNPQPGTLRKYVCVHNSLGPEQPGTPGEYCVERQVWEFYSAWGDPPAGWGV